MNKLVRSNGRLLEVYELGPLVYQLKAARGPIKLHGLFIVDDNAARNWIHELASAQSDDALWRVADCAP